MTYGVLAKLGLNQYTVKKKSVLVLNKEKILQLLHGLSVLVLQG